MTIIPVTGSQEVLLQCQFCVNDEPHAVLILPESAAFLVPGSPGDLSGAIRYNRDV